MRLSITADDPDHLEDWGPALQSNLERELRELGVNAGYDVGLEARITGVWPGGAWGEEASCHIEVTLCRGGSEWRYTVVGYSGSTWARDRIPTAVMQAAKALAGKLAEVRQ